MFNKIVQLLTNENISVECRQNQSLAEYTSVKIGGKADCMCVPKNIDEMVALLSLFHRENINYFMIGSGSNLLINDEGLEIVVICTEKLNHIMIDPDNNQRIIVESGVTLKALSEFALNHGLTGTEFSSGIPGTVGGAVFMNAGAYGGEMKDIVESSLVYDVHEGVMTLTNAEHKFAYRHSAIAENRQIVLKATLSLKHGNKAEIAEKINELTEQRIAKQPLELPSFGSVFKRPEGLFAGKLIMDSRLQGYSIGGATVSTKHAGFIVNTNNAKATDVIQLIAHIQDVVEERFAVRLEPEVKVLEKDGSFRQLK